MRHVFVRFLQDAVDVAGDRAEIAPLGGAVDIDHRLDVVMRDDAGARPRRDPRQAAQILRNPSCSRLVIGTFWRSDIVSMRYCGIWATIG